MLVSDEKIDVQAEGDFIRLYISIAWLEHDMYSVHQ